MSEENSWWDECVAFFRDWVDVSSATDPEIHPDPAGGAEELERIAERMRAREKAPPEKRDREAEEEYQREFHD